MIRLTLAQMRRSAGRLTAAAIAIAIGTAFVAATLLTGEVIKRTSYDAVTAQFAQADLVVTSAASTSETQELLTSVRGVPGVEAADELAATGVQATTGSRLTWLFVLAAMPDERLSTVTVGEGREPSADDEIALPPSAAERLRVAVGDTIEIVTSEPADDGSYQDVTSPVTVVGLSEDPAGAWTQQGGAAIATPAAVASWSFDDGSTTILVAAPQDTAAAQSAIAVANPDAKVVTRDEAAADAVAQLADDSDIITTFVLGFAALALVVAALVIANTFQVLVAQRTRTLALLRCVGAVRGQLRRSVLLEAAILGFTASAAGLLAGAGLAQGALTVLGRMDLDVPLPATITMTPAVVVVPLVVGTLVTVLASLVPARSATRVSPVAALRPADNPEVGTRGGKVRLAFALLLTIGGLVLLVGSVAGARAEASDPVTWLGLGMLGGALSFVGVLVGAVFWVPKVVGLVGRLIARTSPAGRLAAANTVRNPRRTAATSAALLIGVTLVALMSTGAASARSSLSTTLDSHFPVDLSVEVMGGDDGATAGIDPAIVAAVESVTGVEAAEPVKQTDLRFVDDPAGRTYSLYGVSPEAAAMVRSDGLRSALADGAIVVADPGRDLGSQVAVTDRTGATSGATTAPDLVYSDAVTGADAYTTWSTFDEVAPDTAATILWVRISSDSDAGVVAEDVRSALDGFPVGVVSPAAERAQYERIIDTMLAIVVGLLGVAVLIALIGVANTLSLSVLERRRESATLRAVGLTRRSLRWMLAVEGMLIAGVGALLGLALGVLYGWAGASIVFGGLGDLRLAVPWADLGIVLAVALAAGLLASVLPARSAVRTPPVAALAVD